jgi:hypothetical protein
VICAHLALFVCACGAADDALPPPPPVGGADGGAGGGSDASSRFDASALRDAGLASSDASAGFDGGNNLTGYGSRIAQLPAELVGVMPRTDEVLYVRADGTLVSSSADGTNSMSLEVRPELVVRPAPHLWMWTDLTIDRSNGTLSAYVAGSARVERIDDSVASDLFIASPDGDRAIFASGVSELGPLPSSTRSADLVIARADGSDRRTLLSGIHLGRWDEARSAHTGPCSANGAIVDGMTAIVALCRNEISERRDLFAIDLATGGTSTIAEGVLSLVRVGTDRSYLLFLDRDLRMHAVSADGRMVREVAGNDRLTSLAFLDGSRFAYVTMRQELFVTSWPDLVPELLIPLGVDALEAASPSGAHIVFRQSRAPTGLRDLWLARTSSPASPLLLNARTDAYPGDDTFSEDGRFVRWFTEADANFIGDLLVRPSDGTQGAVMLAPRAWYVLNYADPSRVLLMVNTRVSPDSRRIIADMATRIGDGSGILEILAPGVDPTSFVLFADRRRIAYLVPEGSAAGLWVRPL